MPIDFDTLTATLRSTPELPGPYRLKWMSVVFTVREMEKKVAGSSKSFLEERKQPILKAFYNHLEKLLIDGEVQEENVERIYYTLYSILVAITCLWKFWETC